ncbi:uncharacterized protein LOC130753661 [Actinidia eriantha]|uniref:uncharacterized protein LOC130753661 n=1 Tax=Actinidia eriantha TaxID=165200 RepID=UPI0025887D6D|nr:uncharacterized protein LOC130753661 [Actinidia eriantha]
MVVSAEFPSPKDSLILFETVKSVMVHGPCGAQNPNAPCLDNNGRCTKRYPIAFAKGTTMDQDGYPIYRRRNDGRVYTVKGQDVDNRDVMPYNAYLSQMFNCHINVEFSVHICDDLAHKIRTLFSITNPTEAQIEDYGLYLLNQLLQESGKFLTDFPPMPQPIRNWSMIVGNRLIWEQRQLQIDAQQIDVQINFDHLNDKQREAYVAITSSIFQNKGTIFFLGGGAGTGKTFLYNTIATKCRSVAHTVITVASSGIASLLLVGGRTAHSTFCIPLDVRENSICGFGKQSLQAELFRETKLIIWDEVPMQHRYCVKTVDRTLKDIYDNINPFGGIIVILGGDFRQVLPVIPKGVREQIVSASLLRSVLWHDIHVLTLDVNMRLNNMDIENINFANFLMELGFEKQAKALDIKDVVQ